MKVRSGICAFCVAVFAALSPLVVFTWMQVMNQHFGPLVAHWSFLWYGDEAVRSDGQVYGRGNTRQGALDYALPCNAVLRTVRYAVLALLGEVYFPSVFKVKDLDLRKESDSQGQFCRSLLDYFWVFPSHPMNRGTRQDMNDFVEYCRLEYPKLSGEERRILDPLRNNGRVPQELLMPRFTDPARDQFEERRKMPAPYIAENLTMQEREDLLRESMRKSTWNDVVSEIPPAMLKHYSELDLRRLPEIPADWKELSKAVVSGLTAGFDATKLFPKELFNATPSTLARREGPAADRVAILSDGCSATSLTEWGRQMDERLRTGARVNFNLADRQQMMQEPSSDLPLEQKMKADGRTGVATDYCDTGYTHTRRMPHLHALLPDVPKELGLEDDILRVQSYLWMGALRGGFHYDEEANIYVQLIGEADVWLIPQNYTKAFTGGTRMANPPGPTAASADPYLKQIPIHLFRIRPGQGVVFPAFTYHLFCAQSPERVAVNFFFMPKWRRMEYSEADWYTQEGKGPHGMERLALRQIWMRSFARLWDEKRRGLIVNAGKNEYL